MTEQQTAGKEFEKEFDKGHKLLSLHHYARDGEDVKLDIPKEWLPRVHEQVDLLTPTINLERDLVYLYTEDLIQQFPALKEEGKLSVEMVAILETLLHAMDFLTHERFLNAPFEETDREEIKGIIGQVFDKQKTSHFTTSANRPFLNKSPIFVDEEKVFAKDKRVERNRIYMAVLYKKTNSVTEHFQLVGHWIGHVDLKPNRARVSYDEMLAGMTDLEIHEQTLFYLNMVKRTLAWFFNSTSWRSGELHGFDKMDIASKLGVYR